MFRATVCLCLLATSPARANDAGDPPLTRPLTRPPPVVTPSTRPPITRIGFPRTAALPFEERFRLATHRDSSLEIDPLQVEFVAPSRSPAPLRGLLRPTPVELNWSESTLKGVRAGMTAAMFLGALSDTYGWWDGSANPWLIGGAAAAGALYGGTLGHGNSTWRIETRWVDEDP